MEKVKSFFEKIIGYVGMFAALLVAVLIFANDAFRENEMSVLLIGITVVAVFFVFNIFFNKTRRYDSAPDLTSSVFIFAFSMLSVFAVFVRMVAFSLLDVDILGKRALIVYISTIVFFVLIYIAGRLFGGHKAGLISSSIYIFLCSFDVFPVLENLRTGQTKISLALEYTGAALILTSFIVGLLAIKSKKELVSCILSVVSGTIVGACVMIDKNSVFAAICMIAMFAVTRNSYKYVGRDKMQSIKYRSYKYVLFYVLGFIICAAGIVVAFMSLGLKSHIPEWTLYLKDFDGINDIFRYVDSTLTSVWGGIYFERNRFITYVALLMYLFSFVMCAVGCLASIKTKNTKLVFAILFPLLLSAVALAERGDALYISSAIPFVVIVAGYGLSNVINIAYVQNFEIAKNRIIIPEEIKNRDFEQIEKKYNLPEGCASFSLIGENDDSEADIVDATTGEDAAWNTSNEEKQIPSGHIKSGDVVTGDVLDNMLDNLYGDSSDGEILSSDAALDDPKDSVVIFKK